MKNSLDQTLLKIDALLREVREVVAGEAQRKRHPNTGKPWSNEADDELRKLFESGNTIEDLSIYFQRTQNGVRARLVKLGLLEAAEFQPRFVA